MDGAVYAHNIVEDGFRKRYIARYGNDFQIAYAANAYEFAMLVSDLFGKFNPGILPDEIISAFNTVSQRQSAAGSYTVESTPEFGTYFKFPIAVKEILGLEIKVIG